MNIYLPITEIALNIMHLIILGGGIGFISGLLGISGGFLLTPILILMGIPSAIAVASQSAVIIATSSTGAMRHYYRGNIDWQMGTYLLMGGFIGSSIGVWLFTVLHKLGHLDIIIKVAYIVFLSIIGFFILWELGRKKYHQYYNRSVKHKVHQHNWMHHLAFRKRFKKSRLYISIFPPIIVGFFVGVLSALMGIGGGFILVPAMIYLLGMHTSVVVGTALFQGAVVAINATFWQATINQTVDGVLALILIVGGVFGSIGGVRVGSRLSGEKLRFVLAVIVLVVAFKLLFDLLLEPAQIYSLVPWYSGGV